MTPEMQAAVEWVRGLLQSSGLSQRKLGKKCGCSQTQVSYWLRGAGGITPKNFLRVCAAFGSTPPEELRQWAEEPKPEDAEQTPAIPGRWIWEHDGKHREFCKEKHCEWVDRNGICTWGHCMKEVSHANARKSEKD